MADALDIRQDACASRGRQSRPEPLPIFWPKEAGTLFIAAEMGLSTDPMTAARAGR